MTTYKYVLAQEGERKHDIKNTGEYRFECEYLSHGVRGEYGRTWGHRVKLYKDDTEVAKAVIPYYNRTWERYTYESAMRQALYKYKQKLIERDCEFIREHGTGRLPRGTKKMLEEIYENIFEKLDESIKENKLEEEF